MTTRNIFLTTLNTVVALLAISTIFLITSCSPPTRMNRAMSVCPPPPPPPQCKPYRWQGTPFDTSSTGKFAPELYYVIDEVKGANGSEDEFQLVFRPSGDGYLTLGSNQIQRVQRVIRKEVEIVTPEKPIGYSVSFSTGANSISGTKVFFSGYPNGNSWSDVDIYSGILKNDSVVNTVREKFSNNIDYDASPSLSSDGKILFFASERAGGYGGVDIWYVKKLPSGEWSEPINCGKNINTACDDITPFICADNRTLLFSSAGHDNIGGYDIFRTTFSNGVYSVDQGGDASAYFDAPKNLGAPLNTPRDEFFPYSPSKVEEVLYYSSNQNLSTGFNIFVRHKLPFPPKGISNVALINKRRGITSDEKLTTVRVEGEVKDEKKRPVVDADVKVRRVKDREVVAQTNTDQDGKYEVDVPVDTPSEISAQSEDGFYDSYKITIEAKDSLKKIKRNLLVPEKFALRVNFPTNNDDAPYRNVLDSNGRETDQTWIEAVELLAENLQYFGNKVQEVELVGHTDSVSTVASNLELGDRRVKFIVNQLVRRGVNASILRTRSAGEGEPLTPRKNESSSAYNKRNRRVELTKVRKISTTLPPKEDEIESDMNSTKKKK